MTVKPLNALFAAIWLVVFAYLAWLVYSGELVRPEGIRLPFVAVIVGWVVQYVGVLLTSLLFLLAGLGVSALVLFGKWPKRQSVKESVENSPS